MEIAVWITSALLALVYLAAGGMKTFRSKEALQPMMGYVEDFSAAQVRWIGILEILGAIGVILPHLLGVLPWVSGLAAFALALVQVVAIVVHVRRKDGPNAMNFGLLALALFVGIGLLVVL